MRAVGRLQRYNVSSDVWDSVRSVAHPVARMLMLATAPNALRNTRTIWSDWGLRSHAEEQNGIFVGIVEDETREEIAPGMAVSHLFLRHAIC
jgi:hypothetical protein